MERVEGCNVIAYVKFFHVLNKSYFSHKCKIQEKNIDFYRLFHIVICGLDSIDARRWLNAVMVCFYRKVWKE